eukprot:Clim_evm17s225 gene=Clim_evmTU17s225
MTMRAAATRTVRIGGSAPRGTFCRAVRDYARRVRRGIQTNDTDVEDKYDGDKFKLPVQFDHALIDRVGKFTEEEVEAVFQSGSLSAVSPEDPVLDSRHIAVPEVGDIDTQAFVKRARKLFSGDKEFVQGAPTFSQIRKLKNLPEFVFVGHTNAGKSSLLNALLFGAPLARVSAKAGHTKMLNFYRVGGSLTICDAPGYGKGGFRSQLDTIGDYISFRKALKAAFLLVDASKGWQNFDEIMLSLLQSLHRVPYGVVLTKCDLLESEDLEDMGLALEQMLTDHPMAISRVIATSAGDSSDLQVEMDTLRALIWGISRDSSRRC